MSRVSCILILILIVPYIKYQKPKGYSPVPVPEENLPLRFFPQISPYQISDRILRLLELTQPRTSLAGFSQSPLCMTYIKELFSLSQSQSRIIRNIRFLIWNEIRNLSVAMSRVNIWICALMCLIVNFVVASPSQRSKGYWLVSMEDDGPNLSIWVS